MSETVLQLTSPAARGLFRAIVEDPTDDVPRLLLADVLEEAGEGERASFIRVQCELAQMDAPWCKTEARENNCEELGLTTLCDWCALRRREREVLDEYGFDWFGQFTRATGVDEGRGPDRNAWNFRSLGGTLGGCHFRRGFVWKVDCTLEQWCGVVCPVCSGWCSHEAYCEHCQGTGCTGRHGLALVLAAPIEEVIFAGKYPTQHQDFTGRTWHWQRSVGDGPADVPPVLYDLLSGNLFGEPAEWRDALSRAALRWARQEAGLPALRP